MRFVDTCLILVVLVGTAVLAVLMGTAAAMDSGQFENVDPSVRSWFKGVRSPHGVPCCDIADGHRTQERREADTNRYWAVVEGEWREVPPEAVVYNVGNPTGDAVVWYVRQSPDVVYIRCFVPGAGV